MTYLLIVSLLWSFSFVIIKKSLVMLDPYFVSAVRLTLSMLVFLPFLRFRGLSSRLIAKLLALGAVQFGIMYACYTASFAYLPAYMLVLLTTTTPLLVVFFDMLFSRRNVPVFWVAAFLVVIGAWLLKYQGQSLEFDWYGVMLLQISNCAFALGQLWYRQIVKDHAGLNDKQVFPIIYAGGAAICIVASLFTVNFSTLAVTSHQAWLLLYLGVIASGICFFMWNRGATQVGAGTLGLMNNLKIPLGVVVSIVVLKEKFNLWLLIVSLALFMAALWLCRRAEKQQKA